MKKIIIPILLLLAGGQAQAQTAKEQQLLQMEQKLADSSLSEAETYVLYGDLMFDYSSIDVAKTRHYFNEAIAFARKNKNVESEARILTNMGYICHDLGANDSVLFFLDKALKLIEGKELYNEEYANYEVRGIYTFRRYDQESAMNAYLKALEACEKDKEQRVRSKQPIDRCLIAKAKTLANIGDIYGQTFNHEKAAENFVKAIKVMDDNPNVDFGRLQYQLCGDLGVCYMTMQQYDKALPLLGDSYKLAKAEEDNASSVYAASRLSQYYRGINDLPKALQYAKEAAEIAEKTQFPRIILNAERSLIKAYGAMKEYKTAIAYAERLLPKIEESNLGALRELYANLSLFYGALGNGDKVEEFLLKYIDVTEKMSNANLQNALQEMEVKYDVQQKELEIVRRQAEINRRKTLQYIYTGGLAAAGLLLVLLVSIVRLRTKRNKELKEVNATKDKFFSIISHDLKNPSIAQRNALQQLAENDGLFDAETLSQYHAELLKSADYQVELVYNLLNWAQVQTGRMPYKPAVWNMAEVLRPEIAMIRKMAEAKNIDFNVHLPGEAIVTADRNILAAVVRNLLTNAVKFTGEGGAVTLDISHAGTGCIVSISDTGIGMGAEKLQNLFRIDKQQSQTGTAGEQGSGLGLIVCKEFIEKHGSTLHVESAENEGSRFWFEIMANG